MVKTVAQVGRNGGAVNQGGEETKEGAAPAALAETPEEVEVTAATAVTAADRLIEGFIKGIAVVVVAANSPVNNQPVVDIPDQVGVDPSWSAAAKESYKRNESRLAGVDPRILHVLMTKTSHGLASVISLECPHCNEEDAD
jgi:hypothetical protein